MNARRIVLALSLAATGWLWLRAPAEPMAAVATAPRPVRAASDPLPALSVLLPRTQLMAPVAHPSTTRDLFAAHTAPLPQPFVPPVQEAEPAPAPTAPALPFTYLGKKMEAGQWEVFLVQGEQTLVVREGSLIDSRYRVEAIAPPELRLTYLPLGQTQSLAIGGSQ